MRQNWLCAGAAVIALGVGLSAQAPSQGQPATQAPTTQAPPATQRPETQTPPNSATASGEPRMMTLTGCIQAAPSSSPSATPGAVGTAGMASQFILTNARPGMGSGSSTSSGRPASPGATTSPGAPAGAPPSPGSPGATTSPGTPASPPSTPGGATSSTGAASSSSSASSGMTYALEGPASQFKDHVGHQVEITGRLNQSSSSSSSSTSRDADRDSTARDSARPSSSAPMSRFEVQSVKMIAASCSR
jgi:hypothetical protein